MKARGQHVLEEAAQKLRRLQRQEFPRAGVALGYLKVVRPSSSLTMRWLESAGALHLGGQIGQRFAGTDRLRVDDPFFFPDGWRRLAPEVRAAP